MSMSRTSHRAMIDMVCEDAEDMSEIRDLETAKAVIRDIMSPTKLSWVLERIAASRFPNELLLLLTNSDGSDHHQLLPLIQELAKGEVDFDSLSLRALADHYWSLVVRERILRGDFRRAWDEIRRSFWGFEEGERHCWKIRPGARHAHDMAASLKAISGLVGELFEAMRKKALLPDIDLENKPHVEFDQRDFSTPPGIQFVVVTKGYPDFRGFANYRDQNAGTFTVTGRQMLMIAEYFSEKRKTKRRERIKARLSEASPI